MRNALNLLVFDQDLNRKSLAVGRAIFKLGHGQFHLNTLLTPPRPEEQLSLDPEETITFIDYSRIGHWRRAEKGDPALPPWAQHFKFVYLIGFVASVSDLALHQCVEEIRVDIPRFLEGLPVLVRPQSAVLTVPPQDEVRLSRH